MPFGRGARVGWTFRQRGPAASSSSLVSDYELHPHPNPLPRRERGLAMRPCPPQVEPGGRSVMSADCHLYPEPDCPEIIEPVEQVAVPIRPVRRCSGQASSGHTPRENAVMAGRLRLPKNPELNLIPTVWKFWHLPQQVRAPPGPDVIERRSISPHRRQRLFCSGTHLSGLLVGEKASRNGFGELVFVLVSP